jgi:hypothetical protein
MPVSNLTSTQRPTLFRPSDDRICKTCQTVNGYDYPGIRYCNVKLSGPGRLPVACLPYTQINDTSLPNCSLRSLHHSQSDPDTAFIYRSTDSPRIPVTQLYAQHGRAHELQSQGWRTSTTNPNKKRPIILFPRKTGEKQRACLMGTFGGGHIDLYETRSFAYGVWPTITDPLDDLGSHIHTTPRWELHWSDRKQQKQPQFVLAIEYTPTSYGGPWNESIRYHLDAGTSQFLGALCRGMRDKWIDEAEASPVSAHRAIIIPVMTFL